MSKNCIIIPARFAASRFPGKLLQLINDKTILQHVYYNALKSDLIAKVLIATDDERIAMHCKENHMDFIMTSDTHESGTDRVAEALSYLDSEFDLVINIQADEPMVSYKEINALVHLMSAKKANIATLYTERKASIVNNPNTVKLVTDCNDKVLYFSRSTIPYSRKNERGRLLKYHIGMYGFRPKVLQEISKLELSMLESHEKLEQLRWLESGYSVYASLVTYKGIGIDTPEDLETVKQLMAIKPE